MRVAPRLQVSLKSAGNNDNLVPLRFVPCDALHCLAAEGIGQVALSEVTTLGLQDRGRDAAVSEANDDATDQGARQDPNLIPKHERRQKQLSHKQSTSAHGPPHKIRHRLASGNCAIEVKECERHALWALTPCSPENCERSE
uniref:Uncharacterized protein n=1 Tax=Escherichia coli TaxID=562 RepID=A0A385EML8_ECOLX|nr:hypothetical protein GIDALANA_00060 [Escherichia coli]QQZ46593.1 hypothetical protein [Escherichia coli]